MTAADWIARLSLARHPEGGWFRETYRASENVARAALPGRFDRDHAFSTAIYFLLDGGEFSALHTILSDECWFFHAGSPLLLHLIDPDGRYSTRLVGLDAGAEPQAVAPAGWTFGATVADGRGYALVGCTVAPGFEFADFRMPSRAELVAKWPHLADVVTRLTRG